MVVAAVGAEAVVVVVVAVADAPCPGLPCRPVDPRRSAHQHRDRLRRGATSGRREFGSATFAGARTGLATRNR